MRKKTQSTERKENQIMKQKLIAKYFVHDTILELDICPQNWYRFHTDMINVHIKIFVTVSITLTTLNDAI